METELRRVAGFFFCQSISGYGYTQAMPLHLREFNPTPEEIRAACTGGLPEAAEEGLRLFNARHYWHAHEALEAAWLAEPGVVRGLYKGILQAGVMFLQIERQNYVGMMKMHARSAVWLAPWPETCRTVQVGQLRADVAAALAEARRLGPEGLAAFPAGLFPQIRRVPPG